MATQEEEEGHHQPPLGAGEGTATPTESISADSTTQHSQRPEQEPDTKRIRPSTGPEEEGGGGNSSSGEPIVVVAKHPEGMLNGDGASVPPKDSTDKERKKPSEDIKTLLNRRNDLVKQLQECDDEIYDMETSYFEKSISNGNCNVISGWYGFITPSTSAASLKHGAPGTAGSAAGGANGRELSQGLQSQLRKNSNNNGSGSSGVGSGAYRLRESDRIFSLSSVTSKASRQVYQAVPPNAAENKKVSGISNKQRKTASHYHDEDN